MKTSHFRYVTFFFTFVITVLVAATAFGQEFRGSITGNVTDPNGAAVPGAAVTVKNVSTNVGSTTTSNSEGSYTVPFLVPGTYTVSATAAGFKTTTVQNVDVKVDSKLTVDLALQVGTTAEVNIVADASVLEQGSVSTGTLGAWWNSEVLVRSGIRATPHYG